MSEGIIDKKEVVIDAEITEAVEPTPYRPILPPKVGYVERDGEYYPTAETQKSLLMEEQLQNVSVIAASAAGMEIEAEKLARAEQNIYAKVNDSLTAIPQPGGEWRSGVNYTIDDTVDVDGVVWICTKPNCGQEPTDGSIYWKIKEESKYPRWDELGGFIEKGTRCVYPDGEGIDTVWECELAHNKFSTFKPKDGSEQWTRVLKAGDRGTLQPDVIDRGLEAKG